MWHSRTAPHTAHGSQAGLLLVCRTGCCAQAWEENAEWQREFAEIRQQFVKEQQAKAELLQAKESGNLERLKEMKAAILKAQSSSQLNRANLATHNKTWDQKAVRALHAWPCM